jgi:hypothetical protein
MQQAGKGSMETREPEERKALVFDEPQINGFGQQKGVLHTGRGKLGEMATANERE